MSNKVYALVYCYDSIEDVYKSVVLLSKKPIDADAMAGRIALANVALKAAEIEWHSKNPRPIATIINKSHIEYSKEHMMAWFAAHKEWREKFLLTFNIPKELVDHVEDWLNDASREYFEIEEFELYD